jgi:hypothetical protein
MTHNFDAALAIETEIDRMQGAHRGIVAELQARIERQQAELDILRARVHEQRAEIARLFREPRNAA